MPSRLLTLALLAGSLILLAPAARGQHGGGHAGGGMGDRPFGGGEMERGGSSPDSVRPGAGPRGGLMLGPPGRWWDDKHFAKDLKLRPDQQHRMDSIFDANRPTLVRRLQDLQQEETRMGTLVRSKAFDEPALDAEIDRLSQARAELEKATTHVLLQIRGEMDADQITRLEQHQP